MAIGCTGHKVNADGNVAVEFNNTINPLAENISSIELIPLETDSEHLVGGVTDLTIAGDSYIVMDLINNNIFRYSADGKFLGRIGQKGNGPEEYIRINDIQYRDGNLCVFSTPSKLQRFSLDGNMIDSKIFPEMDLGSMSWLTDEGVLTYYGYGAGFLLRPAERRRLALVQRRQTWPGCVRRFIQGDERRYHLLSSGTSHDQHVPVLPQETPQQS